MKNDVAVSTTLEYTRQDLERNRRYGQVSRSGVVYDEELAGPDGMSFVLLREPDTTDQMLQDAVRQLRTDRDVVGSIKVTGVIPQAVAITDKPLAAAGLISYRCKGIFGWIMIGARDDQDAMVQAKRSSEFAKQEDLEIWNGVEYVSVLFEQSNSVDRQRG